MPFLSRLFLGSSFLLFCLESTYLQNIDITAPAAHDDSTMGRRSWARRASVWGGAAPARNQQEVAYNIYDVYDTYAEQKPSSAEMLADMSHNGTGFVAIEVLQNLDGLWSDYVDLKMKLEAIEDTLSFERQNDLYGKISSGLTDISVLSNDLTTQLSAENAAYEDDQHQEELKRFANEYVLWRHNYFLLSDFLNNAEKKDDKDRPPSADDDNFGGQNNTVTNGTTTTSTVVFATTTAASAKTSTTTGSTSASSITTTSTRPASTTSTRPVSTTTATKSTSSRTDSNSAAQTTTPAPEPIYTTTSANVSRLLRPSNGRPYESYQYEASSVEEIPEGSALRHIVEEPKDFDQEKADHLAKLDALDDLYDGAPVDDLFSEAEEDILSGILPGSGILSASGLSELDPTESKLLKMDQDGERLVLLGMIVDNDAIVPARGNQEDIADLTDNVEGLFKPFDPSNLETNSINQSRITVDSETERASGANNVASGGEVQENNTTTTTSRTPPGPSSFLFDTMSLDHLVAGMAVASMILAYMC